MVKARSCIFLPSSSSFAISSRSVSRLLSAADAEKVKAIYTEAKTHLEKIKEADPNREKVNWAYTLYQVYYGLGDAE